MSTQVKGIIAGVIIVIVVLVAFTLHYSSSRRNQATEEAKHADSGYGVDETPGGLGDSESRKTSAIDKDSGSTKSSETSESTKIDPGSQFKAPVAGTTQQSDSASDSKSGGEGVAIQEASKPTGTLAYIKSVLGLSKKGETIAPESSNGSTNSTASPGVVSGSVSGGESSVVQKEAETQGCFTVTFKHKRMMAHSSDETCSHHKNVVKLYHKKVDAKSICVRVDGKPVKFAVNKKDSRELMIAGVAGPEAKITARYCVGKSGCSEDCKVPRDDFMAAIGGEDDLKGGTEIGHWDSDAPSETETKNTAKLNSELKRELAELDEVEPGTSEGVSIFRDWVGEEEIPACGSKQAKLGE